MIHHARQVGIILLARPTPNARALCHGTRTGQGPPDACDSNSGFWLVTPLQSLLWSTPPQPEPSDSKLGVATTGSLGQDLCKGGWAVQRGTRYAAEVP